MVRRHSYTPWLIVICEKPQDFCGNILERTLLLIADGCEKILRGNMYVYFVREESRTKPRIERQVYAVNPPLITLHCVSLTPSGLVQTNGLESPAQRAAADFLLPC